MRHPNLAGTAPGRPELDDVDFAIFEIDGLPFDPLHHGDRGSLIADVEGDRRRRLRLLGLAKSEDGAGTKSERDGHSGELFRFHGKPRMATAKTDRPSRQFN